MSSPEREAIAGNPGRPIGRLELVLAAVLLFVISLLIRFILLPHMTYDYTAFLRRWWLFIETHGGFAALRYEFANYNVPYLYLMAALTYVTSNSLLALKLLSVAFDLMIAYYTYRIVALRWPGRFLPALSAIMVMLLPTVFVNSAMWAQCDGIFAAFGVAGVYYLLRNRPWLATTMLGVALAFKLQAVFLFPLLFLLALRRQLPWRTLLAIPLVLIVLDIPAWLAGRSVKSLANVYLTQGATEKKLTVHAPSVFQFVPDTRLDYLRTASVLFAAATVVLLVLLVAMSRHPVLPQRAILLATAFSIQVPFFHPAMHERYFYLADVLSVAVAFFYARRLWFVPILVQFASFISYQPFLFNSAAIDLRFASFAMAIALFAVCREVCREFALDETFSWNRSTEPVGDSPN